MVFRRSMDSADRNFDIINLTKMYKQRKHCMQCQGIPKHVFQLSCDHPLCLKCAIHLATEAKVKVQQVYSIVCSHCGQQTTFDENLYRELQSYEPHCKLAAEVIESKEKIVSQLRTGKINLPNKKAISCEKYCRQHQDIDLVYVCKTCSNSFICPQCVRNGSHQNHQVVTIQEQGKKIKASLQNQISSIADKVENLKIIESSRIISIRQRSEELQDLKFLIKQQYAEIKETIRLQEESILAKCCQLIELHKRQEQILREEINSELKECQNTGKKLRELLEPYFEDNSLVSSRVNSKLQAIQLISQFNCFKGFQVKQSRIKKPLANQQKFQLEVKELLHKLKQENAAKFKKMQLSSLFKGKNFVQNVASSEVCKNYQKKPEKIERASKIGAEDKQIQFFSLV